MSEDEIRQIEWRNEQEQVWMAEGERCYFIAHAWLLGDLTHEQACCQLTGNDSLFEYDDELIYDEWVDMVRDADEQLLRYGDEVFE